MASLARREYIGHIERFRWYHYDVFVRMLSDLCPVSTCPYDVCERLFLEGLRRTSEFLRDRRFSFIHSRVDDFAYRGPQCFLHRDDARRFLLKPSPDMPIAPPRGVARHPESARFIQCDVCRQNGREKWRRVDADTIAANSPLIWKLDALDKVGVHLRMEQPQVMLFFSLLQL